MISVLSYKLYLRFHKEQVETIREIARHTGVIFLSGAHDQHTAYCSKLGPFDLGKVVEICQEMGELLAEARILDRPVVYHAHRRFAPSSWRKGPYFWVEKPSWARKPAEYMDTRTSSPSGGWCTTTSSFLTAPRSAYRHAVHAHLQRGFPSTRNRKLNYGEEAM